MVAQSVGCGDVHRHFVTPAPATIQKPFNGHANIYAAGRSWLNLCILMIRPNGSDMRHGETNSWSQVPLAYSWSHEASSVASFGALSVVLGLVGLFIWGKGGETKKKRRDFG
ncbi:hypothetical protein CC2G_002420 [Coprinopsis cinerea AmutBmut pab1-1]|nr:hypothetical protein CC2G_002420 [Coprinopsis cinerea AmutBmut pab1-1]